MKYIIVKNKETARKIHGVLKKKFSVKILNHIPGFFDSLLSEVFILENVEPQKDSIIVGEANNYPEGSHLVLNADEALQAESAKLTNLKVLTYGFEESAVLRASDLHMNGGVTFKINYKGNIVPIWQKDKESIYPSLVAICVATILGMNLVEISEALKNS